MIKNTRNLVASVLLSGGIGYWIYSLNNHKKTLISSNTLFKSLKSHLKSSSLVKSLLGNSLEFPVQQVDGTLNIIKGISDITFLVKGDKSSGIITFKGRKISENQWESQVFKLETQNSIYNL
jgi:hypothetical protein